MKKRKGREGGKKEKGGAGTTCLVELGTLYKLKILVATGHCFWRKRENEGGGKRKKKRGGGSFRFSPYTYLHTNSALKEEGKRSGGGEKEGKKKREGGEEVLACNNCKYTIKNIPQPTHHQGRKGRGKKKKKEKKKKRGGSAIHRFTGSFPHCRSGNGGEKRKKEKKKKGKKKGERKDSTP